MSASNIALTSNNNNINNNNVVYSHNFAQLPDEVLLMIFSALPNLKDLKHCHQVCKNWNVCAQDNSLWQVLCKKYFHQNHVDNSTCSAKNTFKKNLIREYNITHNILKFQLTSSLPWHLEYSNYFAPIWQLKEYRFKDIKVGIIERHYDKFLKITDGKGTTLEFSPHEKFSQMHGRENLLCTGGLDSKIKIWDLSKPLDEMLAHTFQSQLMGISNVYFDDRYLVAADSRGTVEVWDLKDYSLKHTFSHPCGLACFARVNNYLITGGGTVWGPMRRKSLITVWDIDSGEQRFVKKFKNRKIPIESLAVSNDGLLLFASVGRVIAIFMILPNGELMLLNERIPGHPNNLHVQHLETKGDSLIVGSLDCERHVGYRPETTFNFCIEEKDNNFLLLLAELFKKDIESAQILFEQLPTKTKKQFYKCLSIILFQKDSDNNVHLSPAGRDMENPEENYPLTKAGEYAYRKENGFQATNEEIARAIRLMHYILYPHQYTIGKISFCLVS